MLKSDNETNLEYSFPRWKYKTLQILLMIPSTYFTPRGIQCPEYLNISLIAFANNFRRNACVLSLLLLLLFSRSVVSDCSTPGFPILYHLPELAQTRVHWVGDAIEPSHPLSSPSPPPTFNLSQHQGLFQWGSSLYQVAKVLEPQHQSFQWIFRTDFL